MSAGSGTPQEWLSELEVDERREVIYNNLAIGVPRPVTSSIHEYMAKEATALLGKPWFEELTFAEVVALNSIEGWDWGMVADYEEGRTTTPRDLVEYRLLQSLYYLYENGDEDVFDDALWGTDRVATSLGFIRRLAGMYEINIRDYWWRMTNEQEG